MLSRRVLLAGAAAAAFGGCGLPPPGRGPTPASPPSGPALPGQQALIALRAALDAASRATLTPAQAALVSWSIDVNDDQRRAVSLSASMASASAREPAPSPADAPMLLASALGGAAAAFGTQALDPRTARPVVWASMAAWATSTAAQLPAAAAAREPARGVRFPAPQDPADAAQAALDAAAATLYGLQVAAGVPGLSATDAEAIASRLGAWASLRDEVAASIRSASATPTPAPPWFQAPRPPDAVAARAMVARLQAAALPVLGRTVAHGPVALRPTLVTALGEVATDVPRWGGLVERWPGLPVT